MEAALLYMLLAVIAVSAVSLLGAVTLFVRKEIIKNITVVLVAFAAGTLFGAAFFEVLPEAFESVGSSALGYVLGGIVLFFFMEKFIHWHHCHRLPAGTPCDVRSFTYMNIIGDSIHNFIDGAVIAAAFLADVHLGIIATLAIALHEIPQELSDFGILVHGGFGVRKALFYNLLSAVVAVGGASITYMFSGAVENSIPVLLSLAAGGFIYIAATDLLPEMHKEEKMSSTLLQFAFLLLGIAMMWLITGALPVV